MARAAAAITEASTAPTMAPVLVDDEGGGVTMASAVAEAKTVEVMAPTLEVAEMAGELRV
jgi:hypothetical protein